MRTQTKPTSKQLNLQHRISRLSSDVAFAISPLSKIDIGSDKYFPLQRELFDLSASRIGRDKASEEWFYLKKTLGEVKSIQNSIGQLRNWLRAPEPRTWRDHYTKNEARDELAVLGIRAGGVRWVRNIKDASVTAFRSRHSRNPVVDISFAGDLAPSYEISDGSHVIRMRTGALAWIGRLGNRRGLLGDGSFVIDAVRHFHLGGEEAVYKVTVAFPSRGYSVRLETRWVRTWPKGFQTIHKSHQSAEKAKYSDELRKAEAAVEAVRVLDEDMASLFSGKAA